jgi:threonine/homoserine/homoserine lactone efflux protein
MLEQVLLGTAFAFAAAVQPGPLQAYLISQTLANGFRRTLPAAFAPILSDIPIATLVLLVLTNVPPLFVLVLQIVGGSFLLYLAYGAYRSFRNYEQALARPSSSVRQTFFKAVLVNLLNPNAYLGWGLVMGPLVAGAWRQSPLTSFAVIAAFYATMILLTIVILALFGRARSIGPRLTRFLVGLSAIALAIFGLYQIWSGGGALLNMITVQG